MSQPTNSPSPETPDDPRKIGKWARTYAQNRSLSVVVILLIMVVYFAAIELGGIALRRGNVLLFWLCLAVTILTLAVILCLSVPRWGRKLSGWLTERLYAKEGTVQVAPPCTSSRRRIGKLLGAMFAMCIAGSIALKSLDIISYPDLYMQPISAIYCVPFLVALWFLQRPAVSPITLLWPALYALHAVLIVAGAPIVFVGQWQSLNMLIPTAGYGILTGLLSHLYGRFALAKLRRAARGGLQNKEAAEDPQP